MEPVPCAQAANARRTARAGCSAAAQAAAPPSAATVAAAATSCRSGGCSVGCHRHGTKRGLGLRLWAIIHSHCSVRFTECERQSSPSCARLPRSRPAAAFSRAAEQLRVSPSTLSQTVRALEERLGVTLLTRTTRRVAPTSAGERLLQGFAPALDQMEAALSEARDGRVRPTGTVRLHAPRPSVPRAGRAGAGAVAGGSARRHARPVDRRRAGLRPSSAPMTLVIRRAAFVDGRHRRARPRRRSAPRGGRLARLSGGPGRAALASMRCRRIAASAGGRSAGSCRAGGFEVGGSAGNGRGQWYADRLALRRGRRRLASRRRHRLRARIPRRRLHREGRARPASRRSSSAVRRVEAVPPRNTSGSRQRRGPSRSF